MLKAQIFYLDTFLEAGSNQDPEMTIELVQHKVIHWAHYTLPRFLILTSILTVLYSYYAIQYSFLKKRHVIYPYCPKIIAYQGPIII